MEPFWSHMLAKPYFENDGVTLYCGDCREILPELQSETFDLVVTDLRTWFPIPADGEAIGA
jgi:DNA modification methylase